MANQTTKVGKVDFENYIKDIKTVYLPMISINPPLNDDNYNDFKFTINHLVGYNFVMFLENEFTDEVKTFQSFKRLDRIVLSIICNNVSLSIRRDLYHVSTSKEACDIIIGRFEGSNHLRCLRVFRKLIELISSRESDSNQNYKLLFQTDNQEIKILK